MDIKSASLFCINYGCLKRDISETETPVNFEVLLDTFGIEVKEVYNGKEAVEDVRTTLPGYYDAENGWTGGNANDQTA